MTFVRSEFETRSVVARMYDGSVGIIRINEFNQRTPAEFGSALSELTAMGARAFVFDIRNNFGGDLEGIIGTLDHIIAENEVLIRIIGRNGREDFRRARTRSELRVPMAVLINGRTASAAELFGAVLRDYDKAVLVGETTYGKGTMQTVLILSDGSAISISNAKYNPPFGENYEGIGVTPHIEVSIPAELLRERHLFQLADDEDTQLQAALAEIRRQLR
jgi:carboxyl-terminal processing protease